MLYSCSNKSSSECNNILLLTKSYYSQNELISTDFVYKSLDTNFYNIINEDYTTNNVLYTAVEVFKDYYDYEGRKQFNQIIFFDTNLNILSGSYLNTKTTDSKIQIEFNNSDIDSIINIDVKLTNKINETLYDTSFCCSNSIELPKINGEITILIKSLKRHYTYKIKPLLYTNNCLKNNLLNNFNYHNRNREKLIKNLKTENNLKVDNKYNGNFSKINK